MLRTLLIVGLLFVIPASRCAAQEHEAASPATGASAHEAPAHNASSHEHGGVDNQPHPLLPPVADWHGVMVIIILGSFLTAAMVGVIVRANMPEDIPPTHSHDEPPGTSGHHGASGTKTVDEPPHGHGHAH